MGTKSSILIMDPQLQAILQQGNDLYNQQIAAQQPKDYGFVGNMLQGIVSPFERVGATALEGMNALSKGQSPLDSGYLNLYLSNPEFQQLQADPLRFGLQRAADLGSIGAYALPGAGSLMGAIGQGALIGGLAGVGGARPGEDLLGAAGSGALTGGVTGGALHGILGLLAPKAAEALTPGANSAEQSIADQVAAKANPDNLNALQQMGKNLETSPFEFKATGAKTGPFNSPSAVKDTQYALSDIFNRYELPVQSAEKNAMSAQRLEGVLGNVKNQILDNIDKEWNAFGLKRALTNDPEILPGLLREDNPVSRALQKIDTYAQQGDGKINASQMEDIIRYIDKNRKFNPPAGSKVAQLDIQNGLAALRQNLRDEVSLAYNQALKNGSIPENLANHNLNTLNSDLSTLINARKYGAFSRMQQAQEGRLFGAPTPVNVTNSLFPGVQVGAKRTAGQILSTLGDAFAGTGGGALGSALQKGVAIAQNPLVQHAIENMSAQGIPNVNAAGPNQGQVSQGMQDMAGTAQQPSSLGDFFNSAYEQSKAQNQQVFRQILGSGKVKTVAEAKQLADMYAPVQKQLPQGMMDRVDSIDRAKEEIGQLASTLQQNAGNLGPIGGRVGDLTTALGMNEQGSSLRTNIGVLNTLLQQALTGTKRASASSPKYMLSAYDSPQQFQAKLGLINDLLNREQQSIVGSYQQGGYDIQP